MPGFRSSPKRIDALAAALLAASLLLLLRPYQGVRHDSILYLGQALALLYPGSFNHDLFFASGSQADYTMVPRLLALLVTGNDPGTVFKWLTLACLAGFAIASSWLLHELLPRKARVPGLLALLLLPAFYGSGRILSYAEPFLTGRSFAEPLILASLAAFVSDRRLVALAGCGLAMLLHPLQALPALVVIWFWLVQDDRRWLRGLWFAIPTLACMWLLPQLHAMFLPVDPIWLEQIQQRNTVALYFGSGPGNWYNLLADAFLIAIAAHIAKGTLRQYCLSLLGATAMLSLADLLLAEALHLSGPITLQFWRVHWLAHWTAMALLPWLFLEYCKLEPPPAWPRMLVFVSMVLFGITPGMAHPLAPGSMALFAAWPWLTKRLGGFLRELLAVAMLGVACMHVVQALNIPAVANGLLERFSVPGARAAALLPAIMVAAAIAGTIAWPRFTPLMRVCSVALLGLALGYAAYHWDQRSSQQVAYTAGSAGSDMPFGVKLMPEDQIFWLEGPLPTWNLLHRPNYMSSAQMAGLVFNRGTAIEGMRRKEQLHVIDGKGRDCRIVVYPNEPHAACNPDDTAARKACSRSGGKLAYFVLPYRLQSRPRGTWTLANGQAGTYYLYACKDLLAESTSASASFPR